MLLNQFTIRYNLLLLYVLDPPCFFKDKDFMGDDLGGLYEIVSLEECQGKCQEKNGCTKFTYIPPDSPRDTHRKRCYMKKGSGGTLTDKTAGEAIAGLPFCSGESMVNHNFDRFSGFGNIVT